MKIGVYASGESASRVVKRNDSRMGAEGRKWLPDWGLGGQASLARRGRSAAASWRAVGARHDSFQELIGDGDGVCIGIGAGVLWRARKAGIVEVGRFGDARQDQDEQPSK